MFWRWTLICIMVPTVILLVTGCGIPQEDYDSVVAERDDAQAQVTSLQSELSAIKQICPPRDFSSRSELQEWLLENGVSERPLASDADSWFAKALELQEDAARDGYIISVDYEGPDEEDLYMIFCTTVINGDLWIWDPETDEITQDLGWTALK